MIVAGRAALLVVLSSTYNKAFLSYMNSYLLYLDPKNILNGKTSKDVEWHWRRLSWRLARRSAGGDFSVSVTAKVPVVAL